MRQTTAILSFLLATALLLTACGSDDDSSAETSGGGESEAAVASAATVLLPYPLGLSWSGLVVGMQRGYFEEENIELSTEAAEGSGFTTQQLIAGNVDYAFAGASDVVVAYEKDPGIRVVMCNKHRNVFQITVPEGSDIASIEDFRGRTLGITEPGGGEVTIVNAILRDAGLEPNEDVELLPIGGAGPQSLNAIKSGEVDGYASSFPDIVTLGIGGLVLTDLTPEKFMPIPGDCLMAHESTLEDEDKRSVVEGIARAWSKGAQYTIDNPDEALDLACAEVPEACADMEYATAYWEVNKDYLSAGEGYLPGQIDPAGWTLTAEILADSGVTDGEVDVAGLIDGDMVSEVQEAWADYDPADIQ